MTGMLIMLAALIILSFFALAVSYKDKKETRE
jgi:hypothetical protein